MCCWCTIIKCMLQRFRIKERVQKAKELKLAGCCMVFSEGPFQDTCAVHIANWCVLLSPDVTLGLSF